MKKYPAKPRNPRVKIPSGYAAWSMREDNNGRFPDEVVADYIREFTRINQLKPCPMIINGKRVVA